MRTQSRQGLDSRSWNSRLSCFHLPRAGTASVPVPPSAPKRHQVVVSSIKKNQPQTNNLSKPRLLLNFKTPFKSHFHCISASTLGKLNNRKFTTIQKPRRFCFVAGKRGLWVVERMGRIEERVLGFKVVLCECSQLGCRNYSGEEWERKGNQSNRAGMMAQGESQQHGEKPHSQCRPGETDKVKRNLGLKGEKRNGV